jgi:glycosyltransferase involved in cell wall biosynthesis
MNPTLSNSEMDGLTAGNQEVAGLVSVIIPAYNSAEFMEPCLQSVFQQTYSYMEIIVVDDGSKDRTRQVLEPYIAEGKIKYLYQQNGGPAAARNLALKHASGEFIAFQDSDDLWIPEKLEKQIAILRRNEDVGMVYSDSEWFGEQWEQQRKTSKKVRNHDLRKAEYFRRGKIFNVLLEYNFISTMSVLVRSRVLKQVGSFREQICGHRFSYGEDFELWLRIARVCNVEFSLQPLVKKRVHPSQITADKRDGYRQLRSLYRFLWSQEDCPKKPLLARKYVENSLKWLIACTLGW